MSKNHSSNMVGIKGIMRGVHGAMADIQSAAIVGARTVEETE